MTDASYDDPLRPHVFDDDIQEYDNRLPNWWLWSFYLACIFSLLYWLHYHALGTGPLPAEEFRAENEAAEARLTSGEVTEESLAALAAEPTAVEKGQQVFVKNCAQCHNANGNGNVGPNLTDKFWIHGGKPMDIYNTIIKGVVTKGMPDYWERQLGRTKCLQATAFILSIKNTNVPGKGPEGDPEQ